MKLLISLMAILTCLLSIYLLSRGAGTMSLTRLNAISFVFYRQVVLSGYIGGTMIALGMYAHRPALAFVTESTKLRAWGWLTYSVFMMSAVVLIVDRLFRLNTRKRFDAYRRASLEPGIEGEGRGLLPLLLTLLSLSAAVYVYVYSPSYPLLDALRGRITEAAAGRIDFRTSFRGSVYIRNLAAYGLAPLICYYLYALYKMRPCARIGRYLVANLLIMAFLFTFNAQKAWFVNYLAGFIIMKSMIDGKLKLSHVMLFVVGGVAFVLVMYGVVAGVDWKTQLRPDSAMAQRILVGNVEAVFASFEFFPHRIESDDLYLVGIPSPILSFFGKTVTPSKRLLMEYLRPDGVERGTAGYLVGYYLAEAWANYGVAGLLLAPAIVGLWVQLCHAWFLRRRKTPLAIAVYAHLATSWEAHGEFVGFLYLKPVILTVILAGTLVLLINAAHKSFWSTARVRLGL